MKLRYIIASLAAVLTLAAGCTKEMPGDLAEVQVSSSFVSIPEAGGSQTITVVATGAWTLDNSGSSWLTVSPASGNAGSTVVTFSADGTVNSRSAVIKININGKTLFKLLCNNS